MHGRSRLGKEQEQGDRCLTAEDDTDEDPTAWSWQKQVLNRRARANGRIMGAGKVIKEAARQRASVRGEVVWRLQAGRGESARAS